MAKRLTIDEVKIRLLDINPNIEVISDEYVNARTRLKCKCKIDNYVWETNWSGLSQGKGCHMCAGNVKYTYEEVKEIIENTSECLLLSDSYKNNESKLTLKCHCGNVFKKTLNDFRHNNKNCAECSVKKVGEQKRTEEELISSYVTEKGYFLLSLEYERGKSIITIIDSEGYKFKVRFADFKKDKKPKRFSFSNTFLKENIKLSVTQNSSYKLLNIDCNRHKHHLITLMCDNNHIYNVNLFQFNQGKRCNKCYRENNVGENHPNYNPSLTDEERMKDRYQLYGKNMKRWAMSVHRKNSYKCVICGSNDKLNAHHLDGWNWCEEKRFDVNNGVTLCRNCHAQFHNEYGYGNNTREQFDRFKSEKLQHA